MRVFVGLKQKTFSSYFFFLEAILLTESNELEKINLEVILAKIEHN